MRNLSLWFAYLVVVGIFAAYVTSRALPAASAGGEVLRFVSTTAFMGYAVALWQMSIWYQRSWGTTIKATIDGLIYGLVTGAIFMYMWPG